MVTPIIVIINNKELQNRARFVLRLTKYSVMEYIRILVGK